MKNALLIALCAAQSCGSPEKTPAQDNDYEARRSEMVRTQIADRGISDPEVLRAMRTVPRHRFVPSQDLADAYHDGPLPIGEGQTISQPYIVALMTSLAGVNKRSTVLEVGTGSGYQAAVLAEIVDSVFTIEIIEPLAASAKAKLTELGYHNVVVRHGDGYNGWAEKAPFDAILVTAAAEDIPQPLIDQLAEGGRMVIPKGEPWSVQELLLLEKKGDRISTRSVLPVRFVPLTRDR